MTEIPMTRIELVAKHVRFYSVACLYNPLDSVLIYQLR